MDLSNKPAVVSDASGEPAPNQNAGADGKKFAIPVKCVKSEMQMAQWQKSEAYYDIIGFINGISMAIQGKKVSENVHISAPMQNMLDVFVKLNKMIDETPPIDQPQRFGNQAYRIWFQKMQDESHQMLLNALTEKYAEATTEIVVYFRESFGNQTRIDYGTGHELAFIMFLCCLFKLEVFVEADSPACGLRLFNAYLLLVRRLQKTYRMEPAGSQGVWSLDDYQFIPFIWGSAQLSLNTPFDPSKFLDEEIINDFKDEYMFIGCINYICQVKTGHFAEHSNQLWSISAVQAWTKINSGLVKMYQKEILSKFPVIQHVLFGSLMPFKLVAPGRPLSIARLGFVPNQPAMRPPAAVETVRST